MGYLAVYLVLSYQHLGTKFCYVEHVGLKKMQWVFVFKVFLGRSWDLFCVIYGAQMIANYLGCKYVT